MIYEVQASMAGTIWKILVQPGDTFSMGDTVAILESMKMEIPIEAEGSGTVGTILLKEGDVVDEGVAIFSYTK